MDKIFLVLCSCVWLVSCRSQQHQEENIAFHYQGDTLCISEHSALAEKIQLLAVELQPYSAEFHTVGTVRAVAGKLAEIAPPFDGRVVQSLVRLGQRVDAGTPVFELSSAEFYEASKNYFQTLQAKKMTEVNLKRQQDLVQHGVGVQKELEEAETTCEFARREYENAAAGLTMFAVRPDELVMGQPLSVVSPIVGEVVQSHIVLGQYVRSDSEPLAVVAELDRVWVAAQVKEKYIGMVRPDDRARIATDTEAAAGREVDGRVYHIGELLDEETRSVQVLIECDNKDRTLKPGMFAAVHFTGTPKEAIVIPSSALLQTESGTYVFVEVGRNRYLKRFVKAATAGQGESVVSEGLQAGEVIVSGGGIYLTGN